MSKLKLLRIEAGLSQIELSLATGVPRYVIQLAEAGLRLPSNEHQQLLCSCLGASLAILFSDGGSK